MYFKQLKLNELSTSVFWFKRHNFLRRASIIIKQFVNNFCLAYSSKLSVRPLDWVLSVDALGPPVQLVLHVSSFKGKTNNVYCLKFCLSLTLKQIEF